MVGSILLLSTEIHTNKWNVLGLKYQYLGRSLIRMGMEGGRVRSNQGAWNCCMRTELWSGRCSQINLAIKLLISNGYEKLSKTFYAWNQNRIYTVVKKWVSALKEVQSRNLLFYHCISWLQVFKVGTQRSSKNDPIFFNNGPIFKPLKLLESLEAPLSSELVKNRCIMRIDVPINSQNLDSMKIQCYSD